MPELRASNRQTRGFGERVAVNFVMQGSNADIIKVAMIRIARPAAEEGRGARLVLQVHDELLLEVPEPELSKVRELVRAEMVRRLRPRSSPRRRRRRRRQLGRGEVLKLPNRVCREPEGSVWDGAWAKGTTIDDRGGVHFPLPTVPADEAVDDSPAFRHPSLGTPRERACVRLPHGKLASPRV